MINVSPNLHYPSNFVFLNDILLIKVIMKFTYISRSICHKIHLLCDQVNNNKLRKIS